MERRLTTIVAADIAGFSRLIGADEEGTLTAQRAHRTELIDRLLEKHGGRVANTAGDSLLIEFPSAVEAVRCAVAVQQGMTARNATVPRDRRIEFRVGINIGDVVDQDGDLLGDGVNIAARLEALAPPSGIVVSRTVRDQIRDRDEVALADLGEVEVKNIARPVRAFQVVQEGEVAVNSKPAPTRRRPALIGTLVAVLVLVTLAGYWVWQRPEFAPANAANFAYPLPDKPSIAVLAFDNLSGDPSQEYISDGFSEDITSVLARVPELFVIARNSAFSYKGKPTKVQTIAEELGVRYLLEGSFQKSGNRIRVSARLIDALGGKEIWANSYDRDLADLFEIKDEIIQSIAFKMHDQLVENYIGWDMHVPMKVNSWLSMLEMQKAANKRTKEDMLAGIEIGEKALAKDLNSVPLMEILGWTYYAAARGRAMEEPKAAWKRAENLANAAIDADPNYAGGYALMARLHNQNRNFTAAVENARTATKLAPSDSGMHAIAGLVYRNSMRPEDAIKSFLLAKRINPRHHGWYSVSLAEAYRMTGDNEKAVAEIGTAVERGVSGYIATYGYLTLTAAYDALGRTTDAQQAYDKALAAYPSISAKFLSNFFQFSDKTHTEDWISVLRKYGLPED